MGALPVIQCLTALCALLAAWGWLRSPAAPPTQVARLDLSLGDITPLSGGGSDIVISPDGSTLAVAGRRGQESGLYVRRIDDADFRKVPGTDDASYPAFSPDGQWLVFRNTAQQTLVKVAVSGSGALQSSSW